jgi:uncharacterized protein (TIGR03435 family)
MHRIALGVSLTVFAAGQAFGQSAPAASVFDVASVRVSEIGRAGGPGSRRQSIQFSPDSVTMRNVTFRASIQWAYHVMDYQITGPDWMASERYDIAAKAAAAVPEDQLRQMMQALLAERFKLAFHRQTKELPAYVLLVAKGGPKFKESDSEGEMNIDPQLNRMIVAIQRAPLSQLVDTLSNILRAPVLDETGLKGKYDITIDVAQYLPEMGGLRGGRGASIDPIPIIMTGLQEELGLKLESRKMPLDLLIVDHAEKVPTEN